MKSTIQPGTTALTDAGAAANSRFGRALCGLAGLLLALAAGCQSPSADYANERVFRAPEDAVRSLEEAAARGDTASLRAIFGPEGDDLVSSGDPAADRAGREVMLVGLRQQWRLEPATDDTRELIVGHEQWPFPIPLRRDSRGWWFDTLAGRDEVLARRIGRNELAAIGALRSYVIAQHEYAGESQDGEPAGVFAQRLRSDPGRRNGLYWPRASPADPASPLGPLAESAIKAGYVEADGDGTRPFRGYFFRILTRQGAAGPGGAQDYIVGGAMRGGFAMIAHPADYGNSGIMTFIVGPDGQIFERDLGADTTAKAGAIAEFNPASGWYAVK